MSENRTAPLLVFDLDGTLVDTAGDLLGTLNALLLREGLSALPLTEVGTLVGAGARALVKRGFHANGVTLDDATTDRLFAEFVTDYGANIASKSKPYPGVLAALDRFHAAGWRFAVCTNKLEGLSRQLIGELGLSHRFQAVCGGDTFPVRKPDARHLLGTIERAGGAATHAVMIGDSRADIDAARNAGIPVIAVSFDYTDTPVSALDPDVVIDHFDALWDAVHGLGLPFASAEARLH